MRPLKNIKMNRILKAFSLVAIIVSFASCKNDDDTKVAPPRDYGVQYASDKDSIMDFLTTHYIDLNTETLDATFPEITNAAEQVSIWDQTDYPLKNIKVTRDEVEYTVYYLSFNEGANDSPSLGDNINITYRGKLFDGTQFDYRPYSSTEVPLYNFISGWWDIMPLFKSGNFVEGNTGEPASFTDYGAGAMFLPSGLAYFNATPSNLVPTYACMVFTFQLLDVTYTDLDNDGILNKDEAAEPGASIEYYDTDGDDIPNYLDNDDDGDGRYTRDEIRKPGTTNEYYTFAEMFNEDGTVKDEFKCSPSSTLPKFLDPACKGGQ